MTFSNLNKKLMRKNRLFIKIYLWFWVTTIILLLTMLTIDIVNQLGREKDDIQYFIDHILVLQGQQAINIFENESSASFKRFIDHMERMPGFHIYIFQNQGKEITGKKVPPEISSLVARATIDNQTAVSVNSEGRNLGIRSIDSYKKNKYLIAAEIPHRPVHLLFPLGPPPGPGPEMHPGSRRHPVSKPLPVLGGTLSFLLIRLAAILIVSGIICYLLARYLATPISKLSQATHRFAAGDFSTRVSSEIGRRKDEISDLAVDFDYMAERIESLLTSQRTLLRDISHELRSPLARINVALELCRSRSGGESIKYLERIEQEAEALNELIEQILTLNRVEYGIGNCKKEEFDLNVLIDKIRNDADFEAGSLNRSVKIIQSEQCHIKGYIKLIRRAVENVLRNAVIYTAPETSVEISLKKVLQDGHSLAAITIRDYGPGVPEQETTNIFQPFYRISEGRDRKTGGTGIGLAIADAAIRLHGGSIRAINVPGGGLSIEILLHEN